MFVYIKTLNELNCIQYVKIIVVVVVNINLVNLKLNIRIRNASLATELKH